MASDIISNKTLLLLRHFSTEPGFILFKVLVVFLFSVLDRYDYFVIVCFSSSSEVEVLLFFQCVKRIF